MYFINFSRHQKQHLQKHKQHLNKKDTDPEYSIIHSKIEYFLDYYQLILLKFGVPSQEDSLDDTPSIYSPHTQS